MTSIVSTILFKRIPQTDAHGRFVEFDKSDPDLRFVDGTMRERILGYLQERDEPLTAKDIAQGISSHTNRVFVQLKKLVLDESVELLNLPGLQPEYQIRKPDDSII